MGPEGSGEDNALMCKECYLKSHQGKKVGEKIQRFSVWLLWDSVVFCGVVLRTGGKSNSCYQ